MADQGHPSLLIVGHGSRRAPANAAFEEVVQQYRQRHPELTVRHAYVELAEPSLADALAELGRTADRVVVLPLFLFRAGHVKNDLPLMIEKARQDYPDVRFEAAEPLGVHPLMWQILHDRVTEAADEGQPAWDETAVVVVGRGASDPDANADFCKLVRLFAEERGIRWALPCFIGVTRPDLAETLELVARVRPRHVLVVPYLLFGGVLVQRIQQMVERFSASRPWTRGRVTAHLGADERLFEVLDHRVSEAMNGRDPLPCDNCRYRPHLANVAGEAEGLRALLWSVRHSFTHTQAAPHEEAHKPLKKHVLVCGNVDCADRGSIRLIDAMRRQLKAGCAEKTVRVTRTSCMGRCGEGPTVAVYPDGVWYRNVKAADAEELVREHLLKDRLVARLVDDIMQ